MSRTGFEPVVSRMRAGCPEPVRRARRVLEGDRVQLAGACRRRTVAVQQRIRRESNPLRVTLQATWLPQPPIQMCERMLTVGFSPSSGGRRSGRESNPPCPFPEGNRPSAGSRNEVVNENERPRFRLDSNQRPPGYHTRRSTTELLVRLMVGDNGHSTAHLSSQGRIRTCIVSINSGGTCQLAHSGMRRRWRESNPQPAG